MVLTSPLAFAASSVPNIRQPILQLGLHNKTRQLDNMNATVRRLCNAACNAHHAFVMTKQSPTPVAELARSHPKSAA